MPARNDRIGARFGRLVVIARTQMRPARWQCQCDCGATKEVAASKLHSGNTKSCGCLRSEDSRLRAAARRQHGHSAGPAGASVLTPTYRSWMAMKQRCLNPNAPNARYYSAIGVSICAAWMTFEGFLADMGERPVGMTLDRYPNPAGNYEPGNCRWATPKQQRANHRTKES